VRFRGSPLIVDQTFLATAKRHGTGIAIVPPQDPGSAGKISQTNFGRVRDGHRINWTRAASSKAERAGPASSAAKAGLVQIVRGRRNPAFRSELERFLSSVHDDCVDPLADCLNALVESRRIQRDHPLEVGILGQAPGNGVGTLPLTSLDCDLHLAGNRLSDGRGNGR
jgi:phage terminase large subunit-like protein